MKRGGKGQGWACSKNPPFLPSRSITTGGNPMKALGAARICLKPTCAPVPFTSSCQGPCHPQQRKHCKHHCMGTKRKAVTIMGCSKRAAHGLAAGPQGTVRT